MWCACALWIRPTRSQSTALLSGVWRRRRRVCRQCFCCLLAVHLVGSDFIAPPMRDSVGGALVPHNKHTRVRAGGTRQKGRGGLTQALHLLRSDKTRGASCPPNRHITSGRYTAYCVVQAPTPSGAPVAHSPPKVDLIRRQSIWRSRHNPPCGAARIFSKSPFPRPLGGCCT